jgi:hypothetical protein
VQIIDIAVLALVIIAERVAPPSVVFSLNQQRIRRAASIRIMAAPGLSTRPYFNRYTEDAIDLCDVLSAFSSQGKATLHELCRVMGLPGKPDGMDGSEVARYHATAGYKILPTIAKPIS